MGNAHPFYRFKQAWNAGFYPDNQIVSDLLNEMQGLITGFLPSWAVIGTTTISQLKQSVQTFVNGFNVSPYYGNFEIVVTTAPDPPFVDYYIYIRDNSLYALDNNQQLLITGQYVASTKVISSATLTSFTPGSYTGTFAPTLIPEELRVEEALNVAYMNGSAIFPITYSYDNSSNVATSGLARGSNWKVTDGVISRFPAPTVPYENQRTFDLPALDGDDTYIISVIERIIQASLIDTDYTDSVLATFNSFSAPDGWTFSVSHPSFTSYERVQFNFVNPDRRKFIIVGRLDSTWLWQRFVSDYYNNAPYAFLSAYVEATPLPYEPNQAGRWLYNNDTLDFEFVEFTAGCYVSPEFYAMPAKPGDQWQFNVVDANLTGVDSANVGLFTEDGQFVQKIGSLKIKTTYTWEMDKTYPSGFCIPNYLTITTAGNLNTVNSIYTLEADYTYVDDLVYTSEIITNWINNLTIGGLCYTEIEDKFILEWSFDNTYGPYIIVGVGCIVNDPPNFVTGSFIYAEINQNSLKQPNASVTIPSKKGCYRMGIYSDPSTTCDLTFAVSITNASSWIDEVNEDYALSYLSVGIWDGSEWVNVSGFQITETTSIEQIVTIFNTLPGVTCAYNDGTNSIDFSWDQTVICDGEYNIKVAITDVTYEIIEGVVQSETQECICGTSYYLYSLSNIINIDASDCFSTIMEFWSDSNTMAEGFEYFGDLKQRVRIGINGGGEKPMIEESVYRQSNGVHRRPQNKQDLSVDLHSDFLDLDTQLALVDATRHPYLVWEGKSIFVKGDVEVATIQDFSTQSSFETLSQVKFQALIQGFQPKNSSCLTC